MCATYCADDTCATVTTLLFSTPPPSFYLSSIRTVTAVFISPISRQQAPSHLFPSVLAIPSAVTHTHTHTHAQTFVHRHSLSLSLLMMAPTGHSRRAPAPSPEGDVAVQRPRTASSAQTCSALAPLPTPAVQHAASRETSATTEVRKRPADTTAADVRDARSLLQSSLVRDLIRENEALLMELAVLRDVRTRHQALERRLCASQEEAARAALATSEAVARTACGLAAHHRLVHHACTVERQLVEETAENEELRSFAELAQAQLASSPAPNASQDASRDGTSPPAKVHRPDRPSGATEGSEDSRRTSLLEITNLRGTVKRLRSVESSDSGTPWERQDRPSAGQRSPEVLTRARKTMC